MVRRKWRLCKMHNGVFGMVESRINTECLPFVRGDESNENSPPLSLASLPFVRGDESPYPGIQTSTLQPAPRVRG